MSARWLALWVAAALVAGTVAHEAAHAVVALALAERVEVAWLEPATYCRYSERWRRYAVAVAPLAVGLVGGGLYLALAGAPATAWGWAAVPGWLVLCFGGGLEEFRFGGDEDLSATAD